MSLSEIDPRVERCSAGGWTYHCPKDGQVWFGIPHDLIRIAKEHWQHEAETDVEDEMTTAPSLTEDQRRAGFQRSLSLRKARTMVKLRIAAGELKIREAFDLPECDGMKVADLLQSLPRVGERRAVTLMESAGIPAHNTVRRCGWRQRERLFDILDQRGN